MGRKIKSFESRRRFAVAKRAKYRIVDSTLGTLSRNSAELKSGQKFRFA